MIHFHQVCNEHFKNVAKNVIQVLAQFDPEDMIIDSFDVIAERIEMKEEVKSVLGKNAGIN